MRGAFTLFAVATLFVLVVVGLFSYDVVLARLQYNQLQAATDAAALAAATYLNDPNNTDEALCKNIGFAYFRKNQLVSGDLSTAAMAPNALSATPGGSQSLFNLVVNMKDRAVVAESGFGLQPSF